MKKIYYFILILGFVGCSEDYTADIYESPKGNEESKELKTQGDGYIESLGYGYDITGEFMAFSSIKNRVVDFAAFLAVSKANKDLYDNPKINITDSRYYYGESYVEMIQEMKRKSSFNLSAASMESLPKPTEGNEKTGVQKENGVFSSSLTFGFDKNTSYSHSYKYSYGLGEVIRKYRKYHVDVTPKEVENYLYPKFKQDVQNLTPNDLVAKYGTHVLFDITTGGYFRVYVKTSVIETKSSEEKKKAIDGAVSGIFKGIKLGFKGSYSKDEADKYNSKNTEQNFRLISYGGNSSGTSVTFKQGEAPTYTINQGAWEASCDDKNSVLMDINWNATYPLYEFVSDPVKKAQIKAEIEQLIESKKVESAKSIPLYNMWNWHRKDNWYTTNYAEAYLHHSNGWQGYGGVACYIFEKPIPGKAMLPLCKMYSKGNYDMWYTTDEAVAQQYHRAGKDEFQGVVGYIFKDLQMDAIPMHGLYNVHYRDTFYAFGQDKLNWRLQDRNNRYGGIAGYVYPPEK